MSQKSKRQRMRNCCFTAWVEEIEFHEELMKYLIVGQEVCPNTNQKHLQGYVEFVRALDFGKVKKLLGGETTHIEPRFGTPQQASSYCKKENKFTEYGTLSKQGKRTDLDNVVECLEEGKSIKDTALEFPKEYIKYHKGIEKLRKFMIKPRDWVPEVTVLYGNTGTGKSRKAREMLSNYWVWTPARGNGLTTMTLTRT